MALFTAFCSFALSQLNPLKHINEKGWKLCTVIGRKNIKFKGSFGKTRALIFEQIFFT